MCGAVNHKSFHLNVRKVFEFAIFHSPSALEEN